MAVAGMRNGSVSWRDQDERSESCTCLYSRGHISIYLLNLAGFAWRSGCGVRHWLG